MKFPRFEPNRLQINKKRYHCVLLFALWDGLLGGTCKASDLVVFWLLSVLKALKTLLHGSVSAIVER